MNINETQKNNDLTTLRNMKLGTFHLGSSMADVLGSGVWNRIMIENLGFAATPVGLLLALRYLLAPLAIQAGEKSDRTRWRGYRRLPWVAGGRLLMVSGYMMVAFCTIALVRYGSFWWFGILGGFAAASIGYSVSGSTFLALVYDRAGDDNARRGRAIGIVWTFLLAGYAVAGVLFSVMLPDYSEGAFLGFFLAVGAIMVIIWAFALWGEEQPQAQNYEKTAIDSEESTSLKEKLHTLLDNPSARSLAFFMLLSFVGGFMQDAVLEPFGGAVFGLSVGETSRFQAYWGSMAIIGSGLSLWLHRRFSFYTYHQLSRQGVVIMAITFGLLSMTALTEREAMLRPTLLLLGLGYGLWNIGTLGLMVQNSRASNVGLDLGVWTVATTFYRGAGVILGAVLFDVFAVALSTKASAYAVVFGVEMILLIMAIPVLNGVSVFEKPKKKRVEFSAESEVVLSLSMD